MFVLHPDRLQRRASREQRGNYLRLHASIVHIDGFELGEGWVRLAMWLTSASPGGFHDWKTLYQDRHRFYMWLHTYLDEANLHYCSPTVPLLEVKNNADPIYKKQQ